MLLECVHKTRKCHAHALKDISLSTAKDHLIFLVFYAIDFVKFSFTFEGLSRAYAKLLRTYMKKVSLIFHF